MRKQTIKKPKKQAIKTVAKSPSKPKKAKLSKSDPEYFAKIGAISAARRKLDSNYFSEMARKSHAPGCRDGYHGGRRKKDSLADEMKAATDS